MFSALTWFWIFYVFMGILIMMEGIFISWDTAEFKEIHFIIKVIASVVALFCWPAVFFIGDDND
jgi:hypothetical protein